MDTNARTVLKIVICLQIAILMNIANSVFSQTIAVTESAGLRRFGYPVTASLEFPMGELKSLDKVRLLNSENQEVACQFTALSQWSDNTVRKCDSDFIATLGPHETQTFRIEIGLGPQKRLPKGIEVKESETSFQVGSNAIQHRIRRDGKPLLESIAFGSDEFLAKDGISTSVKPSAAKIIKSGPFNATIEMGSVRLEYVSSKSWVKLTQRAESSDIVAVDAHFLLTSAPLMWDLGMGSWLYGTTHGLDDHVQLRKETSMWKAVTTSHGKAPSLFATSMVFDGCGHLVDRQKVAAFGIADCSLLDDPQIQLRGDGHFRLSAKCRELTVYFHLVGQPAQVTAVTSPQSMVSPLHVKVTPR